ncbi:MAG: transcriptional repressor [Acidobacteria bacterium]|nr:transcriptional repressor [Acidobacteriota bacterium]
MYKITSADIQQHGLKATPQRLLMLKHIKKNKHISIEKLFKAVSAEFPSISLATVYKNIDALLSTGLIREVSIVGGKHVFEVAKGNHIHFVCTNCGNIVDILQPEKLVSDKVMKRLPGKAEAIELNIYGICDSCRHAD